jgi:hypothetical protein
MTIPWDRKRRLAMKRKIQFAAVRAAAKLGAEHVLIIAMFADGDVYHTMDGGTLPDPTMVKSIYARMYQAQDILEDTTADGGDELN